MCNCGISLKEIPELSHNREMSEKKCIASIMELTTWQKHNKCYYCSCWGNVHHLSDVKKVLEYQKHI